MRPFALGIAAPLLLASLNGGCNDSSEYCEEQGTHAIPVENVPQIGSNEYVCIPDTSSEPSASAASTSDGGANVDSAAPSYSLFGSGDAEAGPPSTCATANVTSVEVVVVAKSIEPVLVDGAAPNGSYALVQASSYGNDAGAPVPVLGAVLVVSGEDLLLGIEVSSPPTLTSASYSMTLVNGALGVVCEAGTGDLSALLPAAGGAEPANVAWDAGAKLLTLRLHAPGVDVDLLFAPQ